MYYSDETSGNTSDSNECSVNTDSNTDKASDTTDSNPKHVPFKTRSGRIAGRFTMLK